MHSRKIIIAAACLIIATAAMAVSAGRFRSIQHNLTR